jgi:hypothetical protein
LWANFFSPLQTRSGHRQSRPWLFKFAGHTTKCHVSSHQNEKYHWCNDRNDIDCWLFL